jgi:type IV pilus assembly protein PilQ
MYKSNLIRVLIILSVVLVATLVYGESQSGEESQPLLLKDVKFKQTRDSLQIILDIGAVVPHYVTMIQNPDRLVVDMNNVRLERGFKDRKFNKLPVERMRIGRHQEFTRLVFDLNSSIKFGEFNSTFRDGKIVITLNRSVQEEIKIEPVKNVVVENAQKPVKSDRVEDGSKEKETPDTSSPQVSAPVQPTVKDEPKKDEGNQPASGEKKVVSEKLETKVEKIESIQKKETFLSEKNNSNILLSSVDIKQYNGYSRLLLSFDSDRFEHRVLKETEKEIGIEVKKCSIASDVPQVIDRVEKLGPISMIRLTKDRKDSSCIISISMRDKIPHQLVKDGKNLNWDFYYSSDRNEKPVQVVKYSEEMVGAEEKGNTVDKQEEDSESKKTYKGKRISMDFKDANIHNILRLISEVAKINIVTSDDVKGTVTVTLRNVPWDQALEIILKTKGLGMKKVGNIIRVAPIEVFQKEAEAEMAKKKALEALEPLKVRLIPVNYGYAKDIVNQVKDVLSDRGTINIDERTNVIIVKDKLENIIKAEGLIRSLDTQTPQVLIEARIVEANTSFVRDIGIQWGGNMVFAPQYGNPTGLAFPNIIGINGGADDARTMNQLSGVQNPAGFAVNMPAPVGAGAGGAIGFILGNANGSANLNLRLSALENTGHVKILSAPRVTTLDNKEAKISSGVSIPISQVSAAGVMTVFVDAKLELAVTPHVTQDGSIMLKIVTTKNEPDFSRTGAQGDPTILKKEAFTQVLVKDGDTTVIGGIYTRRQAEEYAKVPLLSNIPVLGWLFKKKKSSDERTELLIFITPRIVNRSEAIVQQKG